MNAPCFCQCRELNCVTLLEEYPDGSHDHFPWLPCADQVSLIRMHPEQFSQYTKRKERLLRFNRQHKYRKIPDRPLFREHSA